MQRAIVGHKRVQRAIILECNLSDKQGCCQPSAQQQCSSVYSVWAALDGCPNYGLITDVCDSEITVCNMKGDTRMLNPVCKVGHALGPKASFWAQIRLCEVASQQQSP